MTFAISIGRCSMHAKGFPSQYCGDCWWERDLFESWVQLCWCCLMLQQQIWSIQVAPFHHWSMTLIYVISCWLDGMAVSMLLQLIEGIKFCTSDKHKKIWIHSKVIPKQILYSLPLTVRQTVFLFSICQAGQTVICESLMLFSKTRWCLPLEEMLFNLNFTNILCGFWMNRQNFPGNLLYSTIFIKYFEFHCRPYREHHWILSNAVKD